MALAELSRCEATVRPSSFKKREGSSTKTFWQGVQHAREQGFRIQDFELPTSTLPLWERAFEAAEELDRLGRPVPEAVRRWVSHVWLPTAVSNAAA